MPESIIYGPYDMRDPDQREELRKKLILNGAFWFAGIAGGRIVDLSGDNRALLASDMDAMVKLLSAIGPLNEGVSNAKST